MFYTQKQFELSACWVPSKHLKVKNIYIMSTSTTRVQGEQGVGGRKGGREGAGRSKEERVWLLTSSREANPSLKEGQKGQTMLRCRG